MGFIAKILGKENASVQKTPTHGGWNTMEGFLPGSFGMDWYQRGFSPGHDHRHNPDVAAAISLYKRALMSVPTKHIVRQENGAGVELNLDSPLSQVVNRPNQYMSWAECVGVIVDGLLTKGEFACFVSEADLLGDELDLRTTIHPIHNFQMISAQDGSIFYQIDFHDSHKYLGEYWGTYTDEGKLYIPQRHIVHGRFEVDPRNPLRALPPLHAFANSIGLGSVLRQGQEAFHINKGQPSGIISTDQSLTAEQASRLRERWNEMSQKMRQGETPILSNGLRWQSTSVSANESQVIQLLGFTTKDIAKAFGIPPILLGENSGVTYSNLEQLLYGWRTTGLLSVCQIIEQAFEYTFKLPKNEELVFDIGDLARAEALHQADTLTRLVQNGIIKPNEARARLELAPIPGVADELVSQMQIQPMQQNADIAQRAADREDEIAASKLEIANKKPDLDPNGGMADQLLQRIGTSSTPTGPDTEEQSVAEQLKERLNKQVDIESLDLMLKGVFR
jgi:HK97 family phage portal protein